MAVQSRRCLDRGQAALHRPVVLQPSRVYQPHWSFGAFCTGLVLGLPWPLLLSSCGCHHFDSMAAPRRVLPKEIRFALEFQPGAPFQQSIINSIMAPFNLDQLYCSINEIIYPTAWPVGFGGDPDIIDLPTHWVPWDDDIVSTSQNHFYVADLEVYESMAAVATATDNHVSMVPAGPAFDLRMETILIVHQLPMMQLMELVAQSVDRIITLERRLGDAEAAIAQIRVHLGL